MTQTDTAINNAQEYAGTIKNKIGNVVDGARSMVSNSEGVLPHENREGGITKTIETATAKIPSGSFLAFAVGSIGLSALLHYAGKKQDAQFVGQWVPTVLLLGLYNKVVKLHGSD